MCLTLVCVRVWCLYYYLAGKYNATRSAHTASVCACVCACVLMIGSNMSHAPMPVCLKTLLIIGLEKVGFLPAPLYVACTFG